MIHVSRSRVPEPASLTSATAEGSRREATEFFGRSQRSRRQETFPFNPRVYLAEDVIAALRELFAGKCAYCETLIGQTERPEVDHFRPMQGAIGQDGSYADDHYWWLAYEWSNLYLACPDCVRRKGQRFPVAGRRAAVGARDAGLLRERPLLLDPCRDKPEEHLVFSEDGFVSSGTEPGRITIEVLDLNRAQRTDERAAEVDHARAEWDALSDQISTGDPSASEALEALFVAERPYAAIRRQFLHQWASSQQQRVEQFLTDTPTGPSSLEDIAGSVSMVTPAEQTATRQEFEEAKKERETYSIADTSLGDEYYLTSRTINKIEIKNFRVIKELTLEFPSSPDEQGIPWMMLLGENGTGKSSILQAVALALMGESYRNTLGLDPSRIVRTGTRHGSVSVHLTGMLEPIELSFRKDPPGFHSSPSEPKVLLLGYGATRLLPRLHVTPGYSPGHASVDNLFNPFVPLRDAETWLLSLPAKTFDHTARALKRLLPLEGEVHFARRRGKVQVTALGTRRNLNELSDGYQSVLALACDIMQVMLYQWPTMEVAEGIVALDELEVHLHPRWKMHIVKSLREAFPRVQFLMTTHDPLCLRGMASGEAVVLRRYGERDIVAITDLPPVQGLRVDQLLTSEHFGLNSAVDPEVDQLFNSYYALRVRRQRTPEQEALLDELKGRLEHLSLLGDTRRERVMLEAIDQYIADAATVTDTDERRTLRENTKQQVAEIWATVAPERF
jgi:uncharacterized protein (TIGR02646 family)